MGGLDEASSAVLDNVMINPVYQKHARGISDGGAIGKPFVHDVEQIQGAHGVSLQDPRRTASVKRRSLQPLKSNPVIDIAEEDAAPPPPDFTRRGIHIPTRTSSIRQKLSSTRRRFFRSSSVPNSAMPTHSMSTHSMPTTPRSYTQPDSGTDSVHSYDTSPSSVASHPLVPLQHKVLAEDVDRLSPLLEDDPKSFDLVSPSDASSKGGFSIEQRSEQLFSREHLEAIFQDTASLLRFTSFLSLARPRSVPVLIYYLDSQKALRAINYANAIAEALEPIDGHTFTEDPARSTVNAILEGKAQQAFDVLVREDLPAFIAHIWIQVVSVSIQKRVTGSLPPMLRDASEGLAEVFCLTDPSRNDNPIIFASEEFHRTTQYGVSYAIGRNCRFLQGPRTNRNSVARLRKASQEGKEVTELFLNYRRDGSPFMNLLMMAPLLDSRGNLRYFIGAQIDVSGLAKDCTDLDAFQRMLERNEGREPPEEAKDELQELSEMFNNAELDTVRRHGGTMHREHIQDSDDTSIHRPRLLIKETSNGNEGQKVDSRPATPETRLSGRLAGVYKHYLLVRPHPSLRILFTSPSLRVPGVLQSRFLDRIGGSTRVRDSLAEALADGSRGVTAKIRWLTTAAADLDTDRVEEGRPRWIHCTPLLGPSGAVGVWMVVLVDDDKSAPARKPRQAPPISNEIRSDNRGYNDLRGHTQYRSPSPLSPTGRFGVDSADELEPRGGMRTLRNGVVRNLALDSVRRPRSSRGNQGTVRSNSPASIGPSVNSFALN